MKTNQIGPKTSRGELKFVSTVETHCMVPAVDDKGNPVFKTDAKGNNQIRVYKQIPFVYVPPRIITGANGVQTTRHKCWFIIISKEKNGVYFDALKGDLEKRAANPSNHLFSEDDYFKKVNPEAFGIAKENAKLLEESAAKDAKIAELEKRLGLDKKVKSDK